MAPEPEFDWQNCLERVRGMDQGAARELVDQLYPGVFRVVAHRLPRYDLAEDLVQDVFIKMFTKLDQYRGQVPFTNWVMRIATTTCIDALRKQQRRPVVRFSDLSHEEAMALEVAQATDGATAVDGFGAHTLAHRLISELKPADQLLIQWLDLEEKTLAEVAQITGTPAPLLKIRAFRARQRLKKRIQELKTQGAL